MPAERSKSCCSLGNDCNLCTSRRLPRFRTWHGHAEHGVIGVIMARTSSPKTLVSASFFGIAVRILSCILQIRNLLAHAPERLHEEVTADYSDMIYATTCEEIEARRKAFIRKWRLQHRAVAEVAPENSIGTNMNTTRRMFLAILPPCRGLPVSPNSGRTKQFQGGMLLSDATTHALW
jgi:hypothetical protein